MDLASKEMMGLLLCDRSELMIHAEDRSPVFVTAPPFTRAMLFLKNMFNSGFWLLITLKSECIPDKSKDDCSSVRLQDLGLPLASPKCQYPQVTQRAANHSNGVEWLPSLFSHPPISKSERLSGHFCLLVSHTSSPSAGSCLRLFTMILSPLNTTYGI